jgi:signal recognition particle receptor subunit beta
LSLVDLQQNLAEQQKSIFEIPLVLQYNKRDLADRSIPLLPVKLMEEDLNRKLKVPSFAASALRGTGVKATLEECLKLTLHHLQRELKWLR